MPCRACKWTGRGRKMMLPRILQNETVVRMAIGSEPAMATIMVRFGCHTGSDNVAVLSNVSTWMDGDS